MKKKVGIPAERGLEMLIEFNGLETEINETDTPRALITRFNLTGAHTAVWINGKQLLLHDYDTKNFSPGDKVKIIRLLGGG